MLNKFMRYISKTIVKTAVLAMVFVSIANNRGKALLDNKKTEESNVPETVAENRVPVEITSYIDHENKALAIKESEPEVIYLDLTEDAEEADSDDTEYVTLNPADYLDEKFNDEEVTVTLDFAEDEDEDVYTEHEEAEAPEQIVIEVADDGTLYNRVMMQLIYIPDYIQERFFGNGGQIHVVDQSELASTENSEMMGCLKALTTGGVSEYDMYLSSKDDYIEESVIHEMGHFIDFTLGGTDGPNNYAITDGQEFLSIMAAEVSNTTFDDYYKNDPREFFAEMYMEMMINPDSENVQNCPMTTAFIQSCIDQM